MKYFASVILILLLSIGLQPYSSFAAANHDSDIELKTPSSTHSLLFSSTQSQGQRFWAIESEDTEEEEKSLYSKAHAFANNSLIALVGVCILRCIAALTQVLFKTIPPGKDRLHKVPVFVEICSYRI